MFEKLNFSMNKVYPTLVVSTMSSGKSTLINALVGTELLPSMNRACTAKTVAILDNDWKSGFSVHAVDQEGVYTFIPEATKQVVSDYNKTNKTAEMIIEGEIKGIKNSKKSLLLIDTPGINNSLDISHQLATKKVLEEYPEGLILYIINAQQIGTYDDYNFLKLIADKINNNPNFNILFVVNKMDLIDPEKEDPIQLIQNCRKYIEKVGLENPTIIPISASSALLFKKIIYGIELSEMEEEDFVREYRHFKRDGYSLNDYMFKPNLGELDSVITIEGIKYRKSQIIAALDNTGIPLLEREIDEQLVRSLKMKPPLIRCSKKKASNAQDKRSNKRTNKRKRRTSR